MLPKSQRHFIPHPSLLPRELPLASFKDTPPPHRGGGAVWPFLAPRACPVCPTLGSWTALYDDDPGTLGVLWAWIASLRQHSGRCCF